MKNNKMFSLKASFILLIFLAFVSISGCALVESGGDTINLGGDVNHWVDPVNGCDITGDGSYAHPYQTINNTLTNVASSGETVGLKNGSYNEGTIIWPPTNNIKMIGESKTGVVIHGSSRVIEIDTGLDLKKLTIERLTIQGGNDSSNGGGIYLSQSGVTLDAVDVLFKDNYGSGSGNAGAVYVNSETTFNAIRCIFDGNYAGGDGGAILNYGTLNVRRCVFENNYGDRGGAICDYASNVNKVIENSLFFNNYSDPYNGGAIQAMGSGTLEVINCTFVSNEARGSGQGGGIRANDMTIIRNCIFWGNSAADVGNDVYCLSPPGPYVEYSDILEWPTNVVNGPGTLEAVDPGFVVFPPTFIGDLKLNGSEPQVTMGATAVNAPFVDYEGNTRDVPYSMGAFEY